MNMKTKYGIMILLGWLLLGSACNEGDLTSEFTYNGPIPAIADGPSEAQKFVMSCIKNTTITCITR